MKHTPLWNDNTLYVLRKNGSPFSSRLTPCCRFQLEISNDDDQVVLLHGIRLLSSGFFLEKMGLKCLTLVLDCKKGIRYIIYFELIMHFIKWNCGDILNFF